MVVLISSLDVAPPRLRSRLFISSFQRLEITPWTKTRLWGPRVGLATFPPLLRKDGAPMFLVI
jgi:hypothetical protein